MKGYGGRILFVDCTTGAARIETLSEPTARAFLGGNGLAARILYDLVPAGIDARDPNAVISRLPTPTPRAGTFALRVAKVAAHRPFLDSTRCRCRPLSSAPGFTGRADRPAPAPYFFVDEHVGMKSSASVWGQSTREQDALARRGADADAIAIAGPAGGLRSRDGAYVKSEGCPTGASAPSGTERQASVSRARKTMCRSVALRRCWGDREPLRRAAAPHTVSRLSWRPHHALARSQLHLRREVFAEARAIVGES